MFDLSWQIDGWIISNRGVVQRGCGATGKLFGAARMSLMGDAISHAVLPGLAAAFIVSGERQGFLIFLGAAIVGVLTVFLTKSRATFGKVDEGAAIGVVFTFLFALGLIMIVQVADRVDLDPVAFCTDRWKRCPSKVEFQRIAGSARSGQFDGSHPYQLAFRRVALSTTESQYL